jgi:hypothetical protein
MLFDEVDKDGRVHPYRCAIEIGHQSHISPGAILVFAHLWEAAIHELRVAKEHALTAALSKLAPFQTHGGRTKML